MDKQQREYIHHLMLQYSDAMVRLTYRRVGDWHLAEDLVVLRPLVAEIVGNIAAVCLLTGARLNAVRFQLILHIIP